MTVPSKPNLAEATERAKRYGTRVDQEMFAMQMERERAEQNTMCPDLYHCADIDGCPRRGCARRRAIDQPANNG